MIALVFNKAFPVLFVGIRDVMTANAPVYYGFNRIEASRVLYLATTLRDADVSEVDIGIITSYHGQVSKIKKVLKMPHVLVETAEQILTQGKKIIIISTVKSTLKHEGFDKVFNLGFLNNHKRFNFVVIRARSLLIIVRNPHIMS
jgi:helicase MOV-10